MTDENLTPDTPEEGAPVEPEINLLPEAADAPAPEVEAPEGERPEWLPEKFKSPEALAAGYKELEKAYHTKTAAPENYELKLPEGAELADDDVKWLKDMRLTNEQAQKFVDYFYEELIPTVQEARAELHQERLGRSWGMEPKSQAFQQRLTAISSWAKQNLPEAAVREMAKSANGVQALYQMMQAQQDGSAVAAGPMSGASPRPSKEELAQLMSDPRYQYDDEYKNFVRRQFQLAYD